MTYVRIALAAAALAAFATPSQALPLPRAERLGLESTKAVVDAGWRCGRGWHMNARGRCVRNR